MGTGRCHGRSCRLRRRGRLGRLLAPISKSVLVSMAETFFSNFETRAWGGFFGRASDLARFSPERSFHYKELAEWPN